MTAPDPRTQPRAVPEHLYQAAVRRALPLHNTAAFLPPPPKGRTIVIGAGKAGGAMAQAVEALWPADAPLSGLVVTRYHHIAAAPGGLAAAHRGGRGRAPGARCRRPGGGAAHPGDGAGPDEGRPGAVPDLRRRLGAADAAGRGPDAGGQAAHQQGAAEQRRQHRRDELRAQAPLAHQGRAPGRGLRAGAGGDADHQRRAGRRPVGHRQRPDRARRHHLRRRAGDPEALRHRGAGAPCMALLEQGALETPKPGDAAVRGPRGPHDRHAAAVAGSGGGRRRARPACTPTS